jgi:hypothetical protein
VEGSIKGERGARWGKSREGEVEMGGTGEKGDKKGRKKIMTKNEIKKYGENRNITQGIHIMIKKNINTYKFWHTCERRTLNTTK